MISGCIPVIPYKKQIIPSIKGIITYANTPVKDVKIIFFKTNYYKNKNKVTAETFTNHDGKFSFKGDKDVYFYISGDHLTSLSMEIMYKDKIYLGWQNYKIGYAEKSKELICELTDKIDKKNYSKGICKLM